MKTVVELRLMLTESYELSRDWRANANKHRRYFDGDQLDPETIAVLSSRGQPIQWENQYKKIGNKILGYKLGNEQKVSVKGRQRVDMGEGQIIGDVLNSIPDSTDFYAHKELCDEDLMIAGISVMEASVRILPSTDILGNSEKEIHGFHVPFNEAYPDPYSKSPDYSDARYFHRVRWLDRETLYEHFDAALVDTLLSDSNYTNDYDQNEWRNRYGSRDMNRHRILVTTTWTKEYDKALGKRVTRWYIWSNNTMLKCGDSPYLFDGFPFAIRKLFQKKDGYVYGLFEDIMPLQDSINFKHLRIANMLGSTKLLYEEGAVDDPDVFADEYSKDDAVVKMRDGAISDGRIKEIKHNAEIQYLMQQIIDTRKQCQEIIGLNDEALGTASNRLSGFAVEKRQNAGMVGLQRFLTRSENQDLDFYRIGCFYVQQYFDAEQIFRIVERDEAEKYFTINEIERDSYNAVVRENGIPKRRNKIMVGRYDITMQMIPQNNGAIGERYAQGTELLKAAAQINPLLAQRYFPELLRDVQSPAADKMLELVMELEKNAGNPEEAQMQQQQVQLALKQMESKIKNLESQSLVNAARAQHFISQSGGVADQGNGTGGEMG
ncbi:hypothetical protein [Sulfuricurvum sp.]|uniref:portal protein n=1 Tax=Sulfuricurvum sp. TaxID=2025608 RepID=UPI0026100A35|nr:hypothetical protein [Sulfuricurvum sp.]MDD2267449.1 hypothetical protein [Sulfuricurvum sp.]MDD2782829.1 hypothetical protein [Sulfuricurvum sp.]